MADRRETELTDENQKSLTVLLICGSTRLPSHTRSSMHRIEEMLVERNCTTHFWDLRNEILPIADPEFHRAPQNNPDPRVKELVSLAARADAFVLGSPLYHNSYSGVLKNALDHLTIQHFSGKPVGLVAHGAERTVVQACDHLRIVVRGLTGLAIPMQILTIDSDFSSGHGEDGYKVINEDVEHRMMLFSDQLVFYSTRLDSNEK